MRLDSVVIGVDLTATSRRAALWAATVFTPQAQVVLVHCSTAPRGGDDSEEWRIAATALRDLRERIGAERTRQIIRRGDPVRCLIGVATELDADLIAVGASGEPRAPGAMTDASVAERLAASSAVPVLCCGGSLESTPRTLLLPCDGIDSAEAGVWAEALASRFAARLIGVQVPLRPSASMLESAAEAVLAEAARVHADLLIVAAPDPREPALLSHALQPLLRCPRQAVLAVPSAVSIGTSVPRHSAGRERGRLAVVDRA